MTRFSKSRGIALIVSLLLLVAITLMAVSAIRNTTMQEKMSGNLIDREVAKQVAEATLAFASTQLPFVNGAAWYTAALPVPAPGVQDAWNNPLIWANAGTRTVTINGVNHTGEFIVENLGLWASRQDPTCKPRENPLCERQTYRITARNAPLNGRSSVMLQVVWRI